MITYNGYSFDMQVIIMRSIANGIKAPYIRARGNKYFRTLEDKHIDLINFFDSCGKWMGMGKVCESLIGQQKTGTGAEAVELFKAGKEQELADYCMQDAELTWTLWKLIGGDA